VLYEHARTHAAQREISRKGAVLLGRDLTTEAL
jgi:hypothetical protein